MPEWIAHKIYREDNSDMSILSPFLDELDISGIEEITNGLVVHFQDEKISKRIVSICEKLNFRVRHFVTSQKDQNWNEKWESSYHPIKIEDTCIIYAPFHNFKEDNYPYQILINPQMSFGTGHHATTRMMIRSMSKIQFNNKNVLDFGTGTGVLAIFAKMLGAKRVVGIDNSHWAVENAIENAKRNSIEDISFVLSDRPDAEKSEYDIILVNIIRNVIIENLNKIVDMLPADGQILLSGYLEQDSKKMRYELTKRNCRLMEEIKESNWVCQLYCKSSND